MATEIRFYLNLSQEQALKYYQGSARFVVVTAENGQRIQFPAEHIRSFIGTSGIQGWFSITFDKNNKLIDIKRI
ncbi:MAG: DUF2835 domain-containing protein [Piscirickettsiaceae bacterium]|nr:DUF2835 domain-containing protein [Piscirickettsiaceae bacterium]